MDAELPPESPGALYTTEQAARALGVPVGTIHSWRHYRRIHPVGYLRGHSRNHGLVPLYRLDELARHAEQYRRRRPGSKIHAGR